MKFYCQTLHNYGNKDVSKYFTPPPPPSARDTLSHKLNENSLIRRVGWKSCHVPYHTIFVVWSSMEVDGTRSDSYDVISSLLEKDNINRMHILPRQGLTFILTEALMSEDAVRIVLKIKRA